MENAIVTKEQVSEAIINAAENLPYFSDYRGM